MFRKEFSILKASRWINSIKIWMHRDLWFTLDFSALGTYPANFTSKLFGSVTYIEKSCTPDIRVKKHPTYEVNFTVFILNSIYGFYLLI